MRSAILGRRNHQFKVDNLGRLLVYILGHSPDEFGLVPDGDGFVTYKELLQAIHEEPQWRYVRRSHINEVLLGKDRGLFEPEDNRIRVLEKRWRLDMENPSGSLPKVLFTPVRKRAHPVVMENGLKTIEGRHVVLSPDEDMALRIGMRRDKEPVLLEILASAAQRAGALFFPFGNLFLSPQISAKFVSGPPVAKETLERRSGMDIKKETIVSRPVDLTPGTFPMDITRDPDLRRRTKNKKRKGWKEEARKLRKGKRRW